MLRLVNLLLLVILTTATLPDEVLGSCFEDCSQAVSQSDMDSDSSDSIYASVDHESSSQGQSHPSHDCNCPVHAHHCCSHMFFANLIKPIKLVIVNKDYLDQLAYVKQFITEPSLDGLYRPPKFQV